MDKSRQLVGLVVGGYYRLLKHIGGGSFGEIFQGEDTRNKKKVAVKLENAKTHSPQLEIEFKIYTVFSGGNNVPQIYYYGRDTNFNVLVMDLLGLSLEDIFVAGPGTFGLKTVLMLADQMLASLQYVHEKNFIHRDIKPDNFIMGTDQHANQVYIIDFGLSKKYRDPTTKVHIPYVENKALTGTARYASINAMRGCEQSRRDDLESLGYVWLYFLRGSLPWQGLPARTTKQKYDKILKVKLDTSAEQLCKGFPQEFVTYFQIVKNLEFTEEPDYSGLRNMFKDLFLRLGYTYDYQYEWTHATAVPVPVPKSPAPPRPVLPPQPMTQPVTPKHSPREEKPQPTQKAQDDVVLPMLMLRPEKKKEVHITLGVKNQRESQLRRLQNKWESPGPTLPLDRKIGQKSNPQMAFHVSKLQIPMQQPRTQLPSPKRAKDHTQLAKRKVMYRRWGDPGKFDSKLNNRR